VRSAAAKENISVNNKTQQMQQQQQQQQQQQPNDTAVNPHHIQSSSVPSSLSNYIGYHPDGFPAAVPMLAVSQGNGTMATVASNANSAASDLDHALLESLFYNEMVMLENTPAAPIAASDSCLPTEHDTPHTIVEKEILRDFGVGGGTLFPSTNISGSDHFPTSAFTADPTTDTDTTTVHGRIHSENETTFHNPQNLLRSHPVQHYSLHCHQSANHSQQHQQQHQRQQQQYNQNSEAIPSLTSSAIPPFKSNINTQQLIPTSVNNSINIPTKIDVGQSQNQLPMVCTDREAAATAMNSRCGNKDIKIHPVTAASINSSSDTLIDSLASSTATAVRFTRPLPQHPVKTPTVSDGVGHQDELTINNNNKSQIVSVPQDRARQLVDQFATLASRLGIDLPDSVLLSLTSAAARNEGETVAQKIVTTIPDEKKQAQINGDQSLVEMAPTIMELRKTAEESIAAVTRHQKTATSTQNLDEKRKEMSSELTSATEGAITNSNDTINDSKPTYSKRRKKPRLSDCETKLAQLKAENEQLKRHLQNVSNKAHKFDKEKEEAGKNIARLIHDPNAGPREMEMSVRKFSDMYSDYGINRQQELSFHLEQLQRLVNPTNFTKMGLWTLGESNRGPKKNPIAGILVKELDITPQQGRKILDQSEKIRKLCDNLKEAHALLVKLKTLCEKKTRCFQDRMSKCTEILTSKQVVKLIIWINEHTQLLEKVCPGWGTEHIPKKAA